MLHLIRFQGCVVLRLESLSSELHKSLGHPGYACFYHFIHQRNLPFSREETKTMCKNCHTCAEIKPQFL